MAEYRPVTQEYFYYMSDQINSTRVVTDGTGTVVHSAAYSPYGKPMKTWVNNMDPNPKFSGKEREKYSNLDYFGARCYGNQYYRFMSVDPIINKDEVLFNPQAWNLYSYCANNPVSKIDPDGKYHKEVHLVMTYHLAREAGFSSKESLDIASANQDIDDSKLTTSWRPPFFTETESRIIAERHFPSDLQVSNLVNNALRTKRLSDLGEALHSLQDSYAHRGFTVPIGHTVETLAGESPDKTTRNIERALDMAQRTLDAMTDFRGVERKNINRAEMRKFFYEFED